MRTLNSLAVFSVILLVLAAFSFVEPASDNATSPDPIVLDDGAYVMNFGNDGYTCTIRKRFFGLLGPVVGEGNAHLVINEDHLIWHCNGVWFPDPPEKPEKHDIVFLNFFGSMQVTPGGTFQARVKVDFWDF